MASRQAEGALCCVVAVVSAVAQAQPLPNPTEAQVTWVAPPECPDAAALWVEVELCEFSDPSMPTICDCACEQ